MTNGSGKAAHDGVRPYFERTAEDFDRLYAEERQNALMRWLNGRFRCDIAERFLLTMEHARATAPNSVLDVGCGSGRYLAALSQLGIRRLVGIDLSANMLELAKAQVCDTGAEVELIAGDLADWSTDERFDLVIAMGLFDYAGDPLAFLKKMRTLCRHSAIASFPSRHWFRTPVRKFRYRWRRCPVEFFRADQVEHLGRDAGFARVELRKIPGAGMDFVATFWVRSAETDSLTPLVS